MNRPDDFAADSWKVRQAPRHKHGEKLQIYVASVVDQ